MNLFNEPKMEQMGSHMIMSNVMRPINKKYYNIDTKFRDDYDSSKNSNIIITLPQRITKVKSLKVINAEIPFSFFNVSSSLSNNSIIFEDNTGGRTVYTIPSNFYTPSTIATYIAANPINPYIAYSQYNTNFSRFVFTPSGGVTSMKVSFSVDTLGNFDKLELKNKVGWLLGFRVAQFTLTASSPSYVSEAMMDLNGPRYLYLVLDEFTQNNNESFVSPLYRSIINKNIISRINFSNLPLSQFTFGNSIFTPNEKDGTLISDKRTYNNVDLQKIQVELTNEFGNSIDLNGLDFSFCLEIEYQ
jgi:hypothetical protein